MIRVLFEIIVPLLLPTAVYLVWLAAARQRALQTGGRVPAWIEAPWPLLAIIGVVLAATVLVAVSVSQRMPAEGTYVPPTAGPDGRIIPGHVEPVRR